MDDFTPAPIPTPEEIKEACLRLQAGWTEAERYRRRGYKPRKPREVSPGARVFHEEDGRVIRKPLD